MGSKVGSSFQSLGVVWDHGSLLLLVQVNNSIVCAIRPCWVGNAQKWARSLTSENVLR